MSRAFFASISLIVGEAKYSAKCVLANFRRLGWPSPVVPVEELMRDLPLTITFEQSENIGSASISACKFA